MFTFIHTCDLDWQKLTDKLKSEQEQERRTSFFHTFSSNTKQSWVWCPETVLFIFGGKKHGKPR